MTQYLRVVALGSSFAAGPGIEPVENSSAMRSKRNYAHLVAERLGADLIDLTVSGATTSTILDTPQITMEGVEFAPQIEGVPADADLVTLTAGGNDLQFAGSMLYEAWLQRDPNSPLVTMMAPQFPRGIPTPTTEAIEEMAQGLIRIVQTVRSRAAGARVILVDYLTVLGHATGPDNDEPFSAAQKAAFRRIQDGIAQAYGIAAHRTGAEVLRASELSAQHALGSPEPWVLGYQPTLESTAHSFHPNEKGMDAVAGALVELLDG
ncbi:SGNH/GDSL hydrolase family protein [Streptomyces sp. NPDC060322]|uniref:SGNH/GDSL hydrolase family protein n=1 Tax=Streptomyces sp. NPDC060322 TaxID=3347097 RepID=UPI0036482FF0